MTVLGNIFLVAATLLYCFFLYVVYQEGSERSGDAAGGGGYGLAVMLFSVLFAGLMVVIIIAVTARGGFDWVASSSVSRYSMVLLGLLAAMVVMGASALFRHESGPVPYSIKYLIGHAGVWIPLVLLISSAILLNDGLKTSVPPLVYRLPLLMVFVVSGLASAGLLVEWMINSQQEADQHAQQKGSQRQEQYLSEIAAKDPMKQMAAILAFTGDFQEADVRAAAVAKIKTNPDWQQELVRLLDTGEAGQVFTFLEGNEVKNKSLFAEPVRKGILHVAEEFRHTMQRKSTLEEYEFDGDTRSILATVDKFKGLGVDYVPAIRALRGALDEPRAQQVRLNGMATLDAWLKAH